MRLMTFKELRELQKVAATSHVGPGTYNESKGKMNNMTIGKRYGDKYNRNPGPGYYNAERGVSATKYSSAKWNMRGKSKELKLNRTMGPGDYDAKKDFGTQGVKYTIGTKSNYTPRDTTPPVGAYEISNSQTLPKSQQYTMRGRGDASKSQDRNGESVSPGPCHY